MKRTTFHAFRDELEKISGVMSDVGSNVGNTLAAFTSPVAAIKAGWQSGGWSLLSESPNVAKNTVKGKLMRFVPGNKALTLGAAAATAPEAFKKEDPTGKGRSREQRVGSWIGGTALGLASTPFMRGGMLAPLASGVISGTLGDYVGGRIGKKLHDIRKGKRRPDETHFTPNVLADGVSPPSPTGMPHPPQGRSE